MLKSHLLNIFTARHNLLVSAMIDCDSNSVGVVRNLEGLLQKLTEINILNYVLRAPEALLMKLGLTIHIILIVVLYV